MNARQEPRIYQQIALVLLRVVVGWHFLYEGYTKLIAAYWSAQGFLEDAQGPLAGIFRQLAAGPRTLEAVNYLNMWGLTVVGGCLILGLATRAACLGAMAMLALYYLANPPWVGVVHRVGEGAYLYVDKNVVEFFALLALLVFDTGRTAGLDVLIHEWRRRRRAARDRVRSESHADA